MEEVVLKWPLPLMVAVDACLLKKFTDALVDRPHGPSDDLTDHPSMQLTEQ
jgi:hypothetical protein